MLGYFPQPQHLLNCKRRSRLHPEAASPFGYSKQKNPNPSRAIITLDVFGYFCFCGDQQTTAELHHRVMNIGFRLSYPDNRERQLAAGGVQPTTSELHPRVMNIGLRLSYPDIRERQLAAVGA